MARRAMYCGLLDEKVGAFRNRPIEIETPFLWLHATFDKVRMRAVELTSLASEAIAGHELA